MKRIVKLTALSAVVLLFGMGFAGAGFASDRHHEKRHGGSHDEYSAGHYASYQTRHHRGGHLGYGVGISLKYILGNRGGQHIRRHRPHHARLAYDDYARGCHRTSKIVHDGYRYKTKVGGTMCYDAHGHPYVVEGSRHVIHRY